MTDPAPRQAPVDTPHRPLGAPVGGQAPASVATGTMARILQRIDDPDLRPILEGYKGGQLARAVAAELDIVKRVEFLGRVDEETLLHHYARCRAVFFAPFMEDFGFVTLEAGGEWYERVDRAGKPVDDTLGHAWKISYHTVRSMIQTVKRLRMLAERRHAPTSDGRTHLPN